MTLTLLFLLFRLSLLVSGLVKTFVRNLSECLAKLSFELFWMIKLFNAVMSLGTLNLVWAAIFVKFAKLRGISA